MTSWISDDSGGSAAALAGAGLFLGVGLAVLSRRRAGGSRRNGGDDASRDMAAYLHDHLTESDAALQVVDRLRETRHDSDVGRLCDALSRDFGEEREAVKALLDGVGAAARSRKRISGQFAGALLGPLAGGPPRELSLLRALEGLAVAVQSKRCLWRTLQAALPTHPGANGRSFGQFETMAVSQWEAIEAQRGRIARETFLAPESFRRADRRYLPV